MKKFLNSAFNKLPFFWRYNITRVYLPLHFFYYIITFLKREFFIFFFESMSARLFYVP